jgi:hypothetical protein
MNENAALVFHGFLNCSTKEKRQIVDAINNYFDSNDRGLIRRENEEMFSGSSRKNVEWSCVCCGSNPGKD